MRSGRVPDARLTSVGWRHGAASHRSRHDRKTLERMRRRRKGLLSRPLDMLRHTPRKKLA
jgi:hypothetical protein